MWIFINQFNLIRLHHKSVRATWTSTVVCSNQEVLNARQKCHSWPCGY